jgi:prevent-host-death family protein
LRTGCHEFRNHFGRYLEQAAAGHEIEISRRGRPYARLVPVTGRVEHPPSTGRSAFALQSERKQ